MFLDKLQWRFATKSFDESRKVEDEKLAKIMDAIRFAPSSFGLQPFHVFVVSDAEVKKQLREAGFGQAQFTEASHVLVFASRSDVADRVEDLIAKINAPEVFTGMLRGFAEGLEPARASVWASRQAYIALGFALAACAELEIDACPMEGFDRGKFDEILKCGEGMETVVVMTIGYRKEGPSHPKFRFSQEDLFTNL